MKIWNITLWILVPFILSCQSGKKTENSEYINIQKVEVFIVDTNTVNNIIKASGTILPNEKVDIKNELTGRIIKINFKEGSTVPKGKILILIDDSELQAQLKKINAQLRVARSEYKRNKELMAINGISQEELETSLSQLEGLEADSALTSSKISKTRIEAPFSGNIGLRYASEGAYVSQGDVITTLVQNNPLKIEFSVPEKYAHLLKAGKDIEFRVAGSDKVFKATIYAFGSQVEESTRSIRVRALTENINGELISGTFADIILNLEKIENAVLIPTQSLVPLLNSQNVFLIKSGKSILVNIETGIRTENMIQVTSGVQVTDTLAITGLLALKNNMPVVVKSVVQIQNIEAK